MMKHKLLARLTVAAAMAGAVSASETLETEARAIDGPLEAIAAVKTDRSDKKEPSSELFQEAAEITATQTEVTPSRRVEKKPPDPISVPSPFPETFDSIPEISAAIGELDFTVVGTDDAEAIDEPDGSTGKKEPSAVAPESVYYFSLATGREDGWASWYGPGFHGNLTANGEIYDQNALTAAHQTLPFGTQVRVTNLNTGLSVVVRINDRGPFIGGRIIDLSAAAATSIGMYYSGTAPVQVDVLGY